MPWYKAGTVSVAQNSNAVTGTGTSFIANSRVGDAFLGPDGRWYEVTNIASDTAMAISPNYLGAATGAGTYALAPMQGYVKDSADALRALVNQFGSKLGALGTTGNYDTLPVAKGGTGRADGRVLFSEVGVQLAAALYSSQGLYMGWNSSSQGEGHFVVNRGGGAGGFTWRSVNADNSATGPSMIYSYAGLLTVPQLTLTGAPLAVSSGGTGGVTAVAARAGLGLGSSATMPIIGAVGQSGGVPTGAVIERGSNANGEYVRFADGTQICTFKARTIRTLSNTSGPLYFSAAEPVRQFPIAFAAAPSVQITAALESGEGWFLGASTLLNSTTAWPSGFVFSQISRSAQQVCVDYTAIGRWF